MSSSDYFRRPKELTLAGVTSAYQEHLVHETLYSDDTVTHYAHDIAMFCRYMESRHDRRAADIPASSITSASFQAFLKYLASQGNKPSSLRRRLAALRGFGTYLHEQGLSPRPVRVEYSDLPGRYPVAPPFRMSESERAALLHALRTVVPNPLRDYPVFLLFLSCQCTLSEVINLAVDDVDLRAAKLRVTNPEGMERTLPLPLDVHEALAKYLSQRLPLRGTALFLNRFEQPVTKGIVTGALSRIHAVPELRHLRISPQRLREQGIMDKVNSGWTIADLQEYLGLKSPASLMKYYRYAGRDPFRPLTAP